MRPRTSAGLLQAARAAYGVALLVAPGPLVAAAAGGPAGSRARAVARLLGARHLVQAALTAASPSGESLGAGAAIDLIHAGSMAALAVADRRVRRLTLLDVLVETALAATGLSLVTGHARAGRGARP